MYKLERSSHVYFLDKMLHSRDRVIHHNSPIASFREIVCKTWNYFNSFRIFTAQLPNVSHYTPLSSNSRATLQASTAGFDEVKIYNVYYSNITHGRNVTQEKCQNDLENCEHRSSTLMGPYAAIFSQLLLP